MSKVINKGVSEASLDAGLEPRLCLCGNQKRLMWHVVPISVVKST